MKTTRAYLFIAWKKLILAFLLAALAGFAAGLLLVKVGHVPPERIFEASATRLSYALPVFQRGARSGIDMGILLFLWNGLGALATMSFIYSAALFNPEHTQSPPRRVRRVFCGRRPMKLLCYLPGCTRIEAEPLRRLYVWMMIPLLGIILLGIESGLQISTSTMIHGSFLSAFITLLPHGLIELPAFALAGAVVYSAHLRLSLGAHDDGTHDIFRQLEAHRRSLPIGAIAVSVIGGLLVAGWVEAHVTPRLMQML